MQNRCFFPFNTYRRGVRSAQSAACYESSALTQLIKEGYLQRKKLPSIFARWKEQTAYRFPRRWKYTQLLSGNKKNFYLEKFHVSLSKEAFPIILRATGSKLCHFRVYVVSCSILQLLEGNNLISLLEHLSVHWHEPTFKTNIQKEIQNIKKTGISISFHETMRCISAALCASFRVSLRVRDAYRLLYVCLKLSILSRNSYLLKYILKNPNYLTAGDCVASMKEIFASVIADKKNRDSVTRIIVRSFNASEVMLYTRGLSRSKSLPSVEHIVSFGRLLIRKIDELDPSMCSDLVIICTTLANFFDQTRDLSFGLRSFTTHCLHQVHKYLRTRGNRLIGVSQAMDMLIALSFHPKQKLYSHLIIYLAELFLRRKSHSGTRPLMDECLFMLSMLYKANVESRAQPSVFNEIKKNLDIHATEKFSVRSLAPKKLGLNSLQLGEILAASRSLAYYEETFSATFKSALLEVLLNKVEQTDAMFGIQILHKIAKLPRDSFLATDEAISLLISKAHGSVRSLPPISLSLLYTTLSKLSSKFYAHAIVSSLNNRIIETPACAFTPQETALILESIARVTVRVSEIGVGEKHGHTTGIISSFLSMFSNNSNKKAAVHLLTHVSLTVHAFQSTHIAVILHASTHLLPQHTQEHIQLYRAVSQHIIRSRSTYEKLPAKEILVILASFRHFSFSDAEAMKALVSSILRLSFLPDSQLANVLAALAALDCIDDRILEFATKHIQRSSALGFYPGDIRSIFVAYACGKTKPPSSVTDFVQCHPQLFDESDAKAIQEACVVLKIHNLFA